MYFSKLIVSILFFLVVCAAQASDAILLDQTDAIEMSGNKLSKVSTYRIQINNKAGEEYASIQIPYSGVSKLSSIEAKLLTAQGGLIRKLSKSEVKHRSLVSDVAFYQDNMVAEFSLKHSRYPYIIEYSVERRESEFLYVDYWMPVLDATIPTQSASLTLTVPLEYEIDYESHLVGDPEVYEGDKAITYRWKADFKQIGNREPFSPSFSELSPWVKIVPKDFKFENKGSFKTWQSYGEWECSLLENTDDLPDSEKAMINRLVEGITDTREKIKKLYHHLQDHTRYINISVETGGMKPYPASYVAANKYGDCKALANYFKSVLNCIGVESYYTNVYAGNPIRKVSKELPSQQFNHVIVMVPLATDTLWLDCTSKGPFGYVGTFIQNREAFVIKPGGSYFTRIPALDADDVEEVRCVRIKSDEAGLSDVTFSSHYRGGMFEQFKSLNQSYSTEEVSQIFRNYLVDDGFQLNNFNIEKAERDSNQIFVTYQATASRLFQHYGNETLVKNIPFSLPRLKKPGERALPVQLDEPVFKTDTLFYEIPEHYKISSHAPDASIKSDFGDYQCELKEVDGGVRVVRTFHLNRGYYGLDRYPDFYAFWEEMKASENQPILILTTKPN